MTEAVKTALTFLCGAGGLALIEWAREAWKHRVDRKDQKEDKAEEKVDKIAELTKSVDELQKQQEGISTQLDALREAMKCVLLDRIIYLGQKYIEDGEVDFDDRKRLRDMHNSYHNGLKGNGDADAIMRAVDALPLKNHK
jgi:hypothetical protein